MKWLGFHWEPDNWWWEVLRLDELGLSKAWNFQVPDKLCHFLTCFLGTWLGYRLGLNRFLAGFIIWFIMMVPWEIILDGCFRYGASWRDMVADTLGVLVAIWWIASYDIVGQVNDMPK